MSNNQLRHRNKVANSRSAKNNGRTAIDPFSTEAFAVSLSHTESTTASKKASHKLHDLWRTCVEGLKPINEASFEEFDSGNLHRYIFKYAKWLSTTPIPTHRSDGSLLPSNPDNRNCLTTGTLAGYFGNTHHDIKCRFPHHPDFAPKQDGSTDPVWYTALRNEFIKCCSRFQLEIQNCDDIVFGTSKTLPLYRLCRPASRIAAHDYDDYEEHWHFGSEDNPSPSDIVSTVDLRKLNKNSILRHDFNVCTRGMLDGALMNTIYQSACRGGEPKFLNWKECYIDSRSQFIVFSMPEVKTLEKGRPTPFVPDVDCPYTCAYHGFGRYLFVGNGLIRTDAHEKSGCINMVFPTLFNNHSQKSTSDAATDAIRSNLPRNISKDLAMSYSSKSLRQGAITTIATNRYCGLFEVTGRSGHSLNLSIDYYKEADVKSSLPGGVVLAGYDDPDHPVFPARWEILGSANKEMVSQFICAIHGTIDVPDLKPGQRLYSFVCKCACFLVLWHNQVTKDCGHGNSVSSFLKRCARRCGLSDPNYPDLSPEIVLEKWSDILHQDYFQRNCPHLHFESTLKGCASKLHDFAESQYNLSCSVDRLHKQVTQEFQKFNRDLDLIHSSQHNKISELQDHCSKLQSKVAFLKTPTSSPHSSEKHTSSFSPYSSNKGDISEAHAKVKDGMAQLHASLTTNQSCTIRQNSNLATQELSIQATTNQAVHPNMTGLMRDRLNFLELCKENPNATNYSSCVQNMPDKNGLDNTHLEQILLSMKQKGYIPVKRNASEIQGVLLKKLDIPLFIYKEKHLARNCLDLVQYTLQQPGNEEDLKKFFMDYKDFENGEWIKFFSSVSRKAFRQMYILEGKDPDEMEKAARKKKGRKKGTAFVGFGNRVKDYKKKIYSTMDESSRPKEYLDVPILDEIPKPGTPKGNKSIAKMLGYKRKHHSIEKESSV